MLAGDETVGIVGTVPTEPVMGGTVAVGIAAAELTPRLAISAESSGIAARMVVVVDDVGAGVDDMATLVEPEPHIPDSPSVDSIPEVVGDPEVAATPEAIPDVVIVVTPAVATVDAVAGVVAPLSVWPPPS
jgi:hypothetical protein